MAIGSAEEFIRLRSSGEPVEYNRAARETASVDVWKDIIERYPEERFWVAQNKTVPLEILAMLVSDSDPRVRAMIAMKRKLPPDLISHLSGDVDEGRQDGRRNE